MRGAAASSSSVSLLCSYPYLFHARTFYSIYSLTVYCTAAQKKSNCTDNDRLGSRRAERYTNTDE